MLQLQIIKYILKSICVSLTYLNDSDKVLFSFGNNLKTLHIVKTSVAKPKLHCRQFRGDEPDFSLPHEDGIM